MKKLFLFLILLCMGMLVSCSKETSNNDPKKDYVKGKNRFTLLIDGDEREYFVHVPAAYNGNTSVEVVFMLHGTSGNGEEFYNKSGWKEVGELNNVITVFPSSWRYCIFTGGEQKVTTKWNSQPADWTFCAGQKPRDDIYFFKSIIQELNVKFNINNKKIYLVGFSNGGQMAAKCSIELSNVLAAIVESASSFYFDTTYIPLRKLPITFQVGDRDYGPDNVGPAIPLSMLDTFISTPGISLLNGRHYKIAQTHISSFGLNPNFIISGDTTTAAIATYLSANSDPLNVFNFVMIEGLAHSYPNGKNHPMKSAELNWAWLKQFSLP